MWGGCSFDVIKDQLGGPRSAFPHDMTVVAGTQAPLAKANYVALMRFSNLGQARPASRWHTDDAPRTGACGTKDRARARVRSNSVLRHRMDM